MEGARLIDHDQMPTCCQEQTFEWNWYFECRTCGAQWMQGDEAWCP